MRHTLEGRRFFICFAGSLLLAHLSGCRGTVPSSRLAQDVNLPVPRNQLALPEPARLRKADGLAASQLTARTLIPLAFDLQPDIKSAFQRFRSEEARYDFFYSSRDSLTPRLRVTNEFDERRDPIDVTRIRDHSVEVALEKRFFDTTRFDVSVGMRNTDIDDDFGNAPFISADLRYPLWESREKLERASEDIFRRNELDDVQLAYIQEVRSRLQSAMFRFYEVVDLGRQLEFYDEWLADLKSLEQQLVELAPDTAIDGSRLSAEVSRVSSARLDIFGQYHMQMMHLKSNIGVPFYLPLELIDEPFNPFDGLEHDAVLAASIATDPEIATLRNAVSNAEVQLDLARRGRWDIAFLLAGESSLEGRGADEGISDWFVSVGFDVSAVDPRITDSLSRQAQSNIGRFQQAIAARENTIFADTFESLIRLDTLGESLTHLFANLPRFERDYAEGVESYRKGALNIDDLLKRRETLFMQQQETSRLRFLLGANVAELCAATGKFFEFLSEDTARPNEAGS